MRFQHTVPRRSRSAFSLVELMGVMTIFAILVSVGASASLGRLRRSARSTEVTSTQNLADALRDAIVRARAIPDPTNWPSLIGTELAVAVGRVQKTSPGFLRAFLVDPALQIGGADVSAQLRKLPCTQTADGLLEPLNARVMVLSSLSQPLPDLLTNVTASVFSDIWQTPDRNIPTLWTNYTGSGEDILVQRLDLSSLFQRVVLNNLDPENAAIFSIDSFTNALSIPVGSRLETWYFRSTPLNLHLADGTLQGRDMLRQDTSYVFENGRWSRYVSYGRRPPLSTFGDIVEDFLSSAQPPGNQYGSTPQVVVEEIFTYLNSYSAWASDPASPFSSGGSSPLTQTPQYRTLRDSQARLDSFSYNLCR